MNRIAYASKDERENVTLVKLRLLNGDQKDRIKKAGWKPILVPKEVTTETELIAWLLCPNNGLVRPQESIAETGRPKVEPIPDERTSS